MLFALSIVFVAIVAFLGGVFFQQQRRLFHFTAQSFRLCNDYIEAVDSKLKFTLDAKYASMRVRSPQLRSIMQAIDRSLL